MEWRIFFIGPMGVEGAGKTVDYSEHLPKLHRYLIAYLKNAYGYSETKVKGYTLTKGGRVKSVSLKKGKDKITVLTPFNLYGPGDIPKNVFDAIDDSDLIIADLSGNKPAVIYELAFTHALGIKTILVGGTEARSFYLAQTRIVNIDFRPKTISSEDLDNEIDSWLKDRNKRFDSPNPLTNFYGAPLPDISAAAGLAAGFYNNFARPILAGGEIVQRQRVAKQKLLEETRELQGFIVLRPTDLSQKIGHLEEQLWQELRARFPKEVIPGKANEIFVRTEDGPRIPFFLVRDYVIDIPRTMFSLVLSPRLSGKEGDSLKNMQAVLIERFFESAKKLLRRPDNGVEEKRFHFGSVKEIPDIIETGKSKTWA